LCDLLRSNWKRFVQLGKAKRPTAEGKKQASAQTQVVVAEPFHEESLQVFGSAPGGVHPEFPDAIGWFRKSTMLAILA
jgi:hypothetical protein